MISLLRRWYDIMLAPFAPANRAAVGTIFTLFIPMFITQFAQAGYGLVDSIMVGRYSSVDLAGISVGIGIWFAVFLFLIGIMQAAASLISEQVGANQLDNIRPLTHQLLWVALICGIVGAWIVHSLGWILPLIDVPQHIQPITRQYLSMVAFAMPAFTVFAVLRSIAESMGQAKVVTVITLVGLVLVIPANALAIHGCGSIPAMGGAGTGLANSVVAWLTVAMLWAWLCLHPRYASLRLYSHWQLPNLRYIKTILVLGLPIGLAIFFEASLFCFAAPILAPLGAHVLAGHQIALSVTGQFFMLPIALAMASTLLIGKLYGEKNWVDVRQTSQLIYGIATWFALGCAVLLWIIRTHLVSYYTTDTALQYMAATILIAAVAYQFVDAWQVSAAGMLRGLQRPNYAMWATGIIYWGMALPLGWYLARHTQFGVYGFWAAIAMGLTLASAVLSYKLRRVLASLA